MSSTVTQQRMEVEQLRREAAMKRIPVSQAVDDIKVMITISFQNMNLKEFTEIFIFDNIKMFYPCNEKFRMYNHIKQRCDGF